MTPKANIVNSGEVTDKVAVDAGRRLQQAREELKVYLNFLKSHGKCRFKPYNKNRPRKDIVPASPILHDIKVISDFALFDN